MKLTLDRLELKNFKGLKSFTFTPNGKNVKVYGKNRAGKTTLADAWNWLLFGKDTQDKVDFGIKPTDSDGNELHGIDCEVTGTLALDGKAVTLRRVYKEKWVTKRGMADKVHDGHTTDYYVNEVPVKANEYESKIAEIIDQDTFKLLTSPTYFCGQLHWEKQRKALVTICGDVSDQDVIASNKELAGLTELLKDHPFEDLEKVIKAKIKLIADRRKETKIRIDEASDSLPDISMLNVDKLDEDITRKRSILADKRTQLAKLENGSSMADLQKKIDTIESEMIQVKNDYTTRIQAEKANVQSKLDEAQANVRDVQRQIEQKQHVLNQNQSDIDRKTAEMNKLRDYWGVANKKEFTYQQEDTCPTCKQPLPADQVEAARKKALEAFNLLKSSEIEKVAADGTRLRNEVDDIKLVNDGLTKEIATLSEKLAQAQKHVDLVTSSLATTTAKLGKVDELQHYKTKAENKSKLESQLYKLSEDIGPLVAEIKNDVSVTEMVLLTLEDGKSEIRNHEKALKRIAELETDDRKLASQIEGYQQQEFLTEEFTKTKVQMLEQKINSKFKHVRWKLFEEYKTANATGVKEVCLAMINGVAWGKGLNTEGEVTAGTDVINVLSEYYGFVAPIWIDGRESVTELIPTQAQLISLIVSPEDNVLRVEVEEELLQLGEVV